jgi:hypothetical protein
MTDGMMHDHNLDLIMALAEGALADAERDTAEATIAACDECAVELGAQRIALEALGSAPTPELTELEAVRMRRALRDELGLITPEPAAPTRDRSMRWQRLSVGLSAAAVILLFVAIVPALNLFGAGDDSTTGDFTAAAVTTAAPATTAPTAAAERDEADGSPPNAGGGVTLTQSEDMIATEIAPELQWFAFGDSPDLDAIRDASMRGLSAAGDARLLLGYEGGDLGFLAADDRGASRCGAQGIEAFGDGYLIEELGSAVMAETDVVVIAYVNEYTADIQVVAYDAASCEVVASTG